MKPQIILTDNTNPHQNLAFEEFLLETAGENTCVMYLWTNASTVVIGRNQNPWRECKVELLEKSGGKLSRRMTGGGAVYHDLGNLNFSFVMSREDYSLVCQQGVIIGACAALGIPAELSGRNDIISGDRKFSGNAFSFRKNGALHHGTLLVNADLEMLSHFLTVSKNKIESKGVTSVRSRVTNLSEIMPVTKAQLISALIDAFQKEYGKAEVLDAQAFINPRISKLAEKHASWDWLFGETPKFDFEASTRFDWGEIVLCIKLENAVISESRIYSDAMDEEYIKNLWGMLDGILFTSAEMARALGGFSVNEKNVVQHGQLVEWVGGLEI